MEFLNGWFQFAVAWVSLVALICNIAGSRWCFAIWMITDACWCFIDWQHGLPAQAALQAIYLVVNIIGWFSWKRWERQYNGKQTFGKVTSGTLPTEPTDSCPDRK